MSVFALKYVRIIEVLSMRVLELEMSANMRPGTS